MKKSANNSSRIAPMRPAVLPRTASGKIRAFYVCSYGGSGSYMLCDFLKQYGKTYHVHTRNPPNVITRVRHDRFTKLPTKDDEEPTVIYIYRDPIKAIYSRFELQKHLLNIDVNDCNTTIEDVVAHKRDLYGIEEFFDNYTTPHPERTYPIYCIKYEDLFKHMDELTYALGLTGGAKQPVEKVTERVYKLEPELREIYAPLLKKMDDMPFIKIV